MDVTKWIETNLTIDAVKLSPTKKLVILSGGAVKIMPDGKEKIGLLVEIDGKQISWIPNKTTLKNISAIHGRESTSWIGKQIQLDIGVINGKEAVIGKTI